MSKLDQYLLHTTTYPGYWGRGPTIEAALKNAEWVQTGAEVAVYRCDESAHVDSLGRIHGEIEEIGAGTVTLQRTVELEDASGDEGEGEEEEMVSVWVKRTDVYWQQFYVPAHLSPREALDLVHDGGGVYIEDGDIVEGDFGAEIIHYDENGEERYTHFDPDASEGGAQ